MFFFFFKQKTAYEMVYSDWSSDVCSSDLRDRRGPRRAVRAARAREDAMLHEVANALLEEEGVAVRPLDQELPDRGELGRAAEERVEQRAGPGRGQGVDADLVVVRLARPS